MKYYLCLIGLLLIFCQMNTAYGSSSGIGSNIRKAKDDGGSWEAGYTCPEVELDGKNMGKGTFYPTTMENPQTTEERMGMKWSFQGPPGQALKSIMIPKGAFWYLPWRYFNGKFPYTNPAGGNKYINGIVQVNSNTSHTLKIVFAYAILTSYINDDQGNKISSLIENKSTDIRNQITAAKNNAIAAATSYINESSNQEVKNADQQAASLTEQLGALEKSKKEASDRSAASKANSEKLDKESADVEKKLSELENLVNHIDAQIKINTDLISKATQAEDKQPKDINTTLDTATSNSNKIITDQAEKDRAAKK